MTLQLATAAMECTACIRGIRVGEVYMTGFDGPQYNAVRRCEYCTEFVAPGHHMTHEWVRAAILAAKHRLRRQATSRIT